MKIWLTVILLTGALNLMAEDIQVKVNGMVCSMCAQGIQKKFSSEPLVRNLRVDMDQKVVSFQTDEPQQVSDETIKKLITEAGYNVADISRK